MDLTDAKMELVEGLTQATVHRKAHPLGHIGCMPGAPCGVLEISVAAADLIVSALEARCCQEEESGQCEHAEEAFTGGADPLILQDEELGDAKFYDEPPVNGAGVR